MCVWGWGCVCASLCCFLFSVWIFQRVIVRPCLFCQIRASYAVLPGLRRELQHAAERVDQHCCNVSQAPGVFVAVVIGLLTALNYAALYSDSDEHVRAIITTVTVGVSTTLLVLGVSLYFSTPTAARIFTTTDLHTMETPWAVFSAGRTALSQVKFGCTHPSPLGSSVPGNFSNWARRLEAAVTAILVNPYTEEEELNGLSLRLNVLVAGVTIADVIDASIQRGRGRGVGGPGDLLRDLADVCQLLFSGEF
ncbi:uncharacterized protein [Littorina saxatilis]|uniref:uncharacterized protein n=1 Tax=Littorina saxatilis TaxID=31220 RepID=UPI0038B63A40